MPTARPTGRPLAGYGRVSRTMGREGDAYGTVQNQERAIRQWAGLHRVELSEVIIEENVSGATAAEDRELGRLIEDVEADRSGGIVTPTLDRLGRNLIGLLTNAQRIRDAGGRLVSIAESIDTDTDSGKLQLGIMGTLAEIQRDRFARYWDDSVRRAVERGLWVGGQVPIGYLRPIAGTTPTGKAIHGPLVVDEAKAPHVVWAFEARQRHESWSAIAAGLTRRGIPISKSGVVSMVQSRVYLGESFSGDYVNPTAHPALVPRPLWEAAQARGITPRSTGVLSGAGVLAHGIATCAGCGAPLGTASNGRGTLSYTCRNARMSGCREPANIAISRIDPMILSELQERMGRDRDVAGEDAELARVRAAVEAANVEMSAFLEHASASALGDFYAAEIERRRAAITAAQADVERLQARFAASMYANIGTDLATAPIEAQRDVAGALLERVVIRRSRNGAHDLTDRFTVTWR